MRPKRDCNFWHRNIQNFLFKNLYESYRNVNGYKKTEYDARKHGGFIVF